MAVINVASTVKTVLAARASRPRGVDSVVIVS
jgi:hypothetical protein